MGTRGIIARMDKKRGFAGNYHHWDSYPTGLGATLWKLYHRHFERNLKQMLQVLIDDHIGGWSTINEADFNLASGWDVGRGNPVCYCHGERHEEGRLIYPEDDYGAEWVYVFDEEKNTMTVLMAVDEKGIHAVGAFGSNPARKTWHPLGSFSLDGEEPNWKALYSFAMRKNNMPIYRFLESSVFSVLVEVEALSEEEALELIEEGGGVEVEGSLEYYSPYFELQEVINESI